jgi:ferritin-like metal-binding protein YciE
VADVTTRDAKLIQYLKEAYGKEKQLEVALSAHIAMTRRANYKRRLQQHLKETRAHARDVARRINQLGGTAETVSIPGPEVLGEAAARVQGVAQRGVALAQGQLHAVRRISEQERLLKNAKSEYSAEAEEIANYTAIETLAEDVGDAQTARLARGIRRQEERMASFLERVIGQLAKAVAQAEIPASQRDGGRGRKTARRGTARRTAPRRNSVRRRHGARQGAAGAQVNQGAAGRQPGETTGGETEQGGTSGAEARERPTPAQKPPTPAQV